MAKTGVNLQQEGGAPNGKEGYLPTPFDHLVIPFSGEIPAHAA
jgi:hypothetical protein